MISILASLFGTQCITSNTLADCLLILPEITAECDWLITCRPSLFMMTLSVSFVHCMLSYSIFWSQTANKLTYLLNAFLPNFVYIKRRCRAREISALNKWKGRPLATSSTAVKHCQMGRRGESRVLCFSVIDSADIANDRQHNDSLSLFNSNLRPDLQSVTT